MLHTGAFNSVHAHNAIQPVSLHSVRLRIYLRPDESLIAAKSHRAAELKLVSVPLAIDGNSWVMTFVLTKGYRNTTGRKVKTGSSTLKEKKGEKNNNCKL